MTPANLPTTITGCLADLQSRRYRLSDLIVRVQGELHKYGLLLPEDGDKLDGLRSRIDIQRLQIVVLGESGCGKSELINALFLAGLGYRLLPTNGLHPTRTTVEVRYDSQLPIGLWLLPMETRNLALSVLRADPQAWQAMPIDGDNAASTAHSFAALAQVVADGDAATRSEVARWRYAIANVPHPLLEAGLVIVEATGFKGSEPETINELLTSADAVLLVLDSIGSMSATDLSRWEPFFRSPSASAGMGQGSARLVVLNKYAAEVASGNGTTDGTAAQQRESSAQRIAEQLEIDPDCVIPIPAHLGADSLDTQDVNNTVRSQLGLLERTLARRLCSRRDQLTDSVMGVLADVIDNAQQELDGERFRTLDAMRNLNELRAKNEKLMTLVKMQSSAKRQRLSAIIKDLQGVKTLHTRLGLELDALVDTNAAKNEMQTVRQAILQSQTAREAMEITRQYLDNAHVCIEAIDAKIEEVRSLFTQIGAQLNSEFPNATYEVHPFPTQRFTKELHKTRMQAVNDMLNVGSLRAWRADNNAEQFASTVGARVVNIFDIARREATVWLRGLYTALEVPVRAEQTAGVSLDSMERVKSAELDLTSRIAELQGTQDVIKHKHSALAELRAQLAPITQVATQDGAFEETKD